MLPVYMFYMLASFFIYEFFLQIKSEMYFRHIFPTFQKPDCAYLCDLAMANASDAIKPERFGGENFRRWQTWAKFWLVSLGLWWVIYPVFPITEEQTM